MILNVCKWEQSSSKPDVIKSVCTIFDCGKEINEKGSHYCIEHTEYVKNHCAIGTAIIKSVCNCGVHSIGRIALTGKCGTCGKEIL